MKKKVLIIQEYLPVYRKPFFDCIFKKYDLTVVVSKSNFSNFNAEMTSEYILEQGEIKKLFNGSFFWQSDILSIDFVNFDFVVISAAPRNLTYLFLMFYLRIKGVKTIFWGQFWSSTSTTIGYSLRMLLLKLAKGVLFYTDYEKKLYEQKFLNNKNKKNIMGLNNGLDIVDIKKFREDFDFKLRLYNIVFIGRLTEKSKLKELIQAISISKYKNSITLHIIGDGVLRKECEELLSILSIHTQVIFHGVLKEEVDIAKIINGCSLFVYPGNVGLSLIHAMSYGLPCIIHDEIKKHGPEVAALIQSNGGLFYKYNDIDSLVNAIEKYFDDNELLMISSKNNIELTQNTYNVYDMSNRFSKLIDALNDETFLK